MRVINLSKSNLNLISHLFTILGSPSGGSNETQDFSLFFLFDLWYVSSLFKNLRTLPFDLVSVPLNLNKSNVQKLKREIKDPSGFLERIHQFVAL